MMRYRLIGETGLKVSLFSYGTWIAFNELTFSQRCNLLSYLIDHGVNLFDTAEVYGQGLSESNLGESIVTLSVAREKYILSSKVFWGGSSPTESGLHRKHIVEGCNLSLRRLKVDYLDLYICHRPDTETSISETVIAMNMLIQQGKILYWGTSEWPVSAIIEAFYFAKINHLIPPSVEQFEYNMFCQSKGELDIPYLSRKIGIGSMATMPLATGILAGRYNQGIPDNSRASLEQYSCFKAILQSEEGRSKVDFAINLEKIAKKIGITLPQLVLCWCVSNNNISTFILGSKSINQLEENLNTLVLLENNELQSEILTMLSEYVQKQQTEFRNPDYTDVVAES